MTADQGPPRPEVAVGAIVVDDHRLLLVERGREPATGRWSVPGGRVEPGETLAEAVEREVAEETGLQVVCGGLVGWVERMGPDHHFVILDFRAELVGSTRPQAGDDAADVDWVSLDRVTEIDLVDGLLDFLVEHRIV
jgi:ADP-ribose pyrophosphatase YjhB (NUDIX family)